MHFVDGEFKGQVWIFKNLSFEEVKRHYERLPNGYYYQVIVYVRTGKGRFFISDFIKEIQQSPSSELLN